MKITASRRDDIIRRRDEYDAEAKRRREKHDREWLDYSQAQAVVFDVIRDEIFSMLKPFTALQFDVRVNTSWGGFLEARVDCNERNKFDENSALSWSYTATMNKTGEVKKETGSWSGLKACTDAQMASLRQTLGALEALNRIDWVSVLSKELPKYSDYVTQEERMEPRPNFEQELLEAEIEELIGKPVFVAGKTVGEGGYWRPGVDVYYIIHRETPKQYIVSEMPRYYVENDIKENGFDDTFVKYSTNQRRMTKASMFNAIDRPIKILDRSTSL